MPEKVTTESIVFDSLFETKSDDQIQAKMHLKASIMQNIINLQTSLKIKNLVVYFDNNCPYIVFQTNSNALEVDVKSGYNQISDEDSRTANEIRSALKIFDDFYLGRDGFR